MASEPLAGRQRLVSPPAGGRPSNRSESDTTTGINSANSHTEGLAEGSPAESLGLHWQQFEHQQATLPQSAKADRGSWDSANTAAMQPGHVGDDSRWENSHMAALQCWQSLFVPTTKGFASASKHAWSVQCFVHTTGVSA